MDIIITRTQEKGEITEGHLTIDGITVCQTLENSISGLPEGQYEVTITRCKQYMRKMILVDDKQLCDTCPKLETVCANTRRPILCPMIKAGNGIYGRHDGSILVGTKATLGLLTHTKASFDALYDRIRMSIQRGNQVTLQIKNQKS